MVIVYSCEELVGLYNRYLRLATDVWTKLKDLHIRKPVRGSRGGTTKPRKVVHQAGVNVNNLTQVPITIEPTKLNLGEMNCRLVKNKAVYVSDYILEHRLDCVALTETWLKSDGNDCVTTSALVPEGYKLLHVPRSGKRGGGVAVICREQYKMKVETTITATSFESMTVLVTIASYTLRLIVIYRIPPSQQNKLAKSTFLTQFTDLVEHAST